MFKQFKSVISILSLLTAISIATAMLHIPVFAVDEIVTENISNGQSEDDLYLSLDEKAAEIESKDDDSEDGLCEDMFDSYVDNTLEESPDDLNKSSNVELTATSYTYGNFTYTINSDNTVNISGSADGITDITIPSRINGMNVTSISGINSVVANLIIPDSVTTVRPNCLNSTEWYKSQPNGLVYAGKVAYKCKETVPSSISFKSGTVGINANLCAYEHDLTSITLPEGLKYIGERAFYGSGITYVEIPQSVTSIGFEAFVNCRNLTMIKVNDGNQYYSDVNGILYDKNQTCAICCPIKRELTNYSLPDTVKKIESSAFEQCSIKNIIIPEGVIEVGKDAFAFSEVLETVYLPGSITSYDENPRNYDNCRIFYQSHSLRKVTIGYGLQKIGDRMFAECESLQEINIPDSVITIGQSAFAGCKKLPNIKIPNEMKVIPGGIFSGCSSITEVDINKNITEIGFGAFSGTSISEITIPENVTRLGGYSFSDCPNLATVNYNAINCTTTGGGKDSMQPGPVFNGSNNLKQVNIGGNVQKLEKYLFEGCEGLSSISIPKNVTDIGDIFSDKTSATIYGYKGSAAQTYAQNKSFNFIEIVDGYNALTAALKPSVASVAPGETVDVTVDVYAPTKEFRSTVVGFDIDFDLNVFEEPTLSMAPEWEDVSGYNANDKRIVIQSMRSTIRKIDDPNYLPVGKITFKVRADAPAGETEFKITPVVASDENYEKADFEVVNAKVIIDRKPVEPQVVSTPTISTSNITGGKSATISCTTSGATIYYTTDGTTPTTNSNRYNGAISLTSAGTTTIKAIAVKSGYNNSSVATQSVTVSRAATPTASVSSGTITSPTSVTLSCSTSGATIYYTTNGNTPTTSSTKYTEAITINSTTTLKAIAVASGYANSSAATYTYTLETPNVNVPSVTTGDASNITKTSAKLSGNITDNGGGTVEKREFVYWSKYNSVSKYTVSADSNFTATLTNLSPDTEYYYYAKASNSAGSGIGLAKTFKTTAEDKPQSITVSPSYISIGAGEKYQLLATVLPSTASNRNVVWTSSNNNVAKVDKNGMVTGVKEGTATITVTTEVNRLKATCTVKVADNTINGTFDFSEWNMASNTGYWATDGHNWDTADVTGGNYQIAAAYLARWDGAVLEKNDKYPSYNGNPRALYKEINSDYHVQDIVYIPERENSNDNNEIKAAVMNYGAIYSSFICWENYADLNNKNYYFPESGPEAKNGGHAIAIVGWDDNYSASHFTVRPPGNGAFICKNSWGTDSGENGYFYISYYDKYIGKRGGSAAVTSLERNSNYNTIYQYDPLGSVSYCGYEDTTYAANVFPQRGSSLQKSEILRAVSFYTYHKNTSYEVYVVKDYKDSSSLSSPGTAQAVGTIQDAGYHTVKLNSSIQLSAGTRFAIVIKLNTPGENSWFYYEYPEEGYSSKARANADESYISSNGRSWTDLTTIDKNANFCIKAFTDNGNAANSAQLFAAIDNDNRYYESDKVYTLDEVLDKGIKINEDYVEYIQARDNERALASDESEESVPLGEIPPIIEFGGNSVSFVDGAILPSRYDLRNENCVTAVRDQGNWGTCWAHAMYASLESNLLKRSKTVSRSSLGDSAPEDYLAAVGQYGIGVNDISFDEEILLMPVGETKYLNVKILPENATEKSVIWSSSDDNIVSVDTNGCVTANQIGTATITASSVDGGYTTQCNIQVEAGESVSNVTFIEESVTKAVGDLFMLDYIINPAVASNQNVTWSSNNPNVVSVNENGLLTALSIGTAEITVTTEDGNKTAVATVNVNNGYDCEITSIASHLTQHDNDIFGSVDVEITNRTANDSSATIIFAVYNNNDALQYIVTSDEVLSAGNNDKTFNNIYIENIKLSECHIKCFLWDSLETMRPLSEAAEIEIK